MSRRFLYVSGCDDSTTIEITDLPVDQIEALETVAARITTASTNQCMPTAHVVDEYHYGARDLIEGEKDS